MLNRRSGLMCLAVMVALSGDSLMAQAPDNGVKSTDLNPLSVALSYDSMKGKQVAHPDFILPSVDDPRQLIQLSEFRGKKVLLLHFASW